MGKGEVRALVTLNNMFGSNINSLRSRKPLKSIDTCSFF